MTVYGTLCFIIKDNKVLLQKKSNEKFGGGRWNMPGGKRKDNENLEDCATREVLEETGLKVRNLEEVG